MYLLVGSDLRVIKPFCFIRRIIYTKLEQNLHSYFLNEIIDTEVHFC
jgi:hypothetical protein